jgi:DNA (cytosine-5)-methyltransferase 1
MRYLSVCSGIEAATVAWHPLGWTPAAFSEIEPFPCSLLKHHYPTVPNLGDMTKFKEWDLDGSIDLLVGGTPCQSFSVAGLRKGLDDPRGNLMLTYLAIADKFRPEWLVWENVPGVLSSNGGKDFGSFLGGLAELGYGFAYRILDAQHFGVPQRRRRVFVVGNLRNWRLAAAVLFERHSMQGNSAPSREARQDVAGTIEASLGRSRGAGTPTAGLIAPTLNAAFGSKLGLDNQHIDSGGGYSLPAVSLFLNAGGMGRLDAESETLIPTNGGRFVADPIAFHPTQDPISSTDGSTHCMGTGTSQGCATIAVAYIGGIDYENNGFAIDAPSGPLMKGSPTGSGWPLPAVAFETTQITSPANYSNPKPGDPCHPLAAGADAPAVAFQSMQVRRLTPRECERLQGFPDDYTRIPLRNKKPTDVLKFSADGPRYKALGNSMAVPCMAWIGQRIAAVAAIKLRMAA